MQGRQPSRSKPLSFLPYDIYWVRGMGLKTNHAGCNTPVGPVAAFQREVWILNTLRAKQNVGSQGLLTFREAAPMQLGPLKLPGYKLR